MIKMEELFKLRSNMILEGYSQKEINKISDEIKEKESGYSQYILEDGEGAGGGSGDGAGSIGVSGVGYANASIGGMGNVVSAQPSTIPGATIGSDWADHGGTIGSGDISVPMNVGGKNVYHKVPVKSQGSIRTPKKKKFDLKQMRSDFDKMTNTKPGKVMNFDNFNKEQINKVTKVKDL